jgi:hypothetical protein
MPLPDVFLVFKSLEPWTRDPAFLAAALPPAGSFMSRIESIRGRAPWPTRRLLSNGDLRLVLPGL